MSLSGFSRRDFLKAASATAIIGPSMGCSDARAKSGPRSTVLIMADDLGTELGCYGNASVQTPNIDALAAAGTRFANSFANVSSCSPARSVLFSGLHTHQTGQYGLAHGSANFHSFANVQTLPLRLKEAGIASKMIGKYHLKPADRYPFDEVVEGFQGGRDVIAMAQAAEAYMLAHQAEPFFLTVSFVDPHRDGSGGFGNDQNYTGVSEVPYNPDALEVPNYLEDNTANRSDLAGYYQSISRLDQGVGMVLDAITTAGLDDNVLVIFVSDNGAAFVNGKTNLYEGGIRTPIIVRDPTKSLTGIASQAMVGHVNVAPTVAEWMELAPLNSSAGSLLAILDVESPNDGWNRSFASHIAHGAELYYPMRMIRTNRYKLIRNLAYRTLYRPPGDVTQSAQWQSLLSGESNSIGGRSLNSYFFRPEFELYDLQEDPQELNNLAEDSGFANLYQELKTELRLWMQSTRDPWLGMLNINNQITRALEN